MKKKDDWIHFQALVESALFSSAEGQTASSSERRLEGAEWYEAWRWTRIRSEVKKLFQKFLEVFRDARQPSPSCRGNTELDYIENAQFLWIYLKWTLWRYFNLMWFLGTLITVSFFKGCIIANISKKGVGSSFHRNGELQSLDISVNFIYCAKQRR